MIHVESFLIESMYSVYSLMQLIDNAAPNKVVISEPENFNGDYGPTLAGLRKPVPKRE